MRRLRSSVEREGLAGTSAFFDPRVDVNLFSNIARNPLGKPYVFRVDGIYFDLAETSGPNAALNRDVYEGVRGARGLIIQSEFDRRLLAAFHPVDKPYRVVNNGVDLDVFRADGPNMRASLGIGPDAFVIVTSAKWRAHKRLKAVEEVFLRYAGMRDGPCHLLVLGETPEKRLAGDARVHYLGRLDARDLPSAYRAGDALLFLSWLDHCPNSVVEAIACGLPVVCTNQGGTRELVEMTNGGLVAEADEQFRFELVDLYHPPEPDYQAVLEALAEVDSRHDEFVLSRDTSRIDIRSVARRYVSFLEEIITVDGAVGG
jgi:glycosyltransferase involved in cell wall biosynthesis